MKIKAVLFACLIGLVPALTYAQQDEDVRGAFMTTRPKALRRAVNQLPPTGPAIAVPNQV